MTLAMTTSEIGAVAYGVAGLIVMIAIAVSDFTKKKTSAPGLIGELASLHVIGMAIFLLLWPIWLLLLLFRDDD